MPPPMLFHAAAAMVLAARDARQSDYAAAFSDLIFSPDAADAAMMTMMPDAASR